MLKINIVSFGTLKPELKTLAENYAKMIGRWANLNEVVIRERVYASVNLQVKHDTELAIEKLSKMKNVYLCDFEGKQHSSIQFSHLFFTDEITFVIGGSNGLSREAFSKFISFSKMTFPHQLFRVFLLEQTYRGLAINNGSNYHK